MKMGFLLSHLGDTDLAKTFVVSANEYLEEDSSSDVIAFVNNQQRPVKHPIFASMNVNEAFDYNGAVIATDMTMAARLANFPGPRLRYYYLWELDWTKNLDWSFEEMLEVFHNPQMSIIARSDEDKKLIENCWNCRVQAVIPECNVRAFAEMIRKDEN